MRRCLIVPSHRQGVRLLADIVPLSSVQFLGQSLIEYWLSHLASSGTKEVLVLVESPGSHTRHVIGDGARWGLEAEVLEEPCELRPEQALLKLTGACNLDEARAGMTVVDHFPETCHPLFTSYADCFAALLNWMPRAKMPDRVGLREVQPGVWVNLPCHVSRRARLKAPCWVGKHVFVGADAIIGPGAVLEEGAFVEAQAEVSHSWVGPDTLVGRGTRLANSIAIGSRLINYQTESLAVVPDPFVLCSLRRSPARVLGAEEATPLPAASEEPSHWLWKALLLHKER
jgi:NDP-sugar pyrophosphorylase family protein